MPNSSVHQKMVNMKMQGSVTSSTSVLMAFLVKNYVQTVWYLTL